MLDNTFNFRYVDQQRCAPLDFAPWTSCCPGWKSKIVFLNQNVIAIDTVPIP